MGVYDSVMVPCPRCKRKHEFQSKSGRCCLDMYELEDAPDDVMENVNRHAPCECECGCLYMVDDATRTPIEVSAEELDKKKAQQYRVMASMMLEDLARKVRRGEITRLRFSWDGGAALEFTLYDAKETLEDH